ncbi:HIT family protein [Amycolatopsis saalfeldensis]|uniref:HIT family protein n=1 Tax=Amycolatopsis saalfeldensis TaxID=394193 RepID=UPI0011603B8B|nr:HIT domain-containing protein [Amycolatopsis saalfeldensis]
MRPAEVTAPATPDDHSKICTFCDELAGNSSAFVDRGLATGRTDYVLWENDDFAIVPCLGALADWYVLLLPKRHLLSFAYLSPQERANARTAIKEATRKLRTVSGDNVVVFEHGSFDFRNRGGSCQDHAHLHLVATPRPSAGLVDLVEGLVKFASTEDWLEDAANLVHDRRTSYLALDDGQGALIAEATGAPSQFFRRAMCTWLGADSGDWDWLVFPQEERLARMLGKHAEFETA